MLGGEHMSPSNTQPALDLRAVLCQVLRSGEAIPAELPDYCLWQGDVEAFLDGLAERPLFDLIVTSPPYNLGKPYETRQEFRDYLEWQARVIDKCVRRLCDTGSICWQVGNYVEGTGRRASVLPLDIVFHDVFRRFDLTLRNRIVWQYGHGLHCKHRFSGRHEVVLWYTKTDDYTFNLDAVRVPPKYPGKKHYKGPRAGQYSCNPRGKNPEDVWEIPNVKSNHLEKTIHPCQFPVALIERLILALTREGELVFDPFAGVASAGVAAALTGRRFCGCEVDRDYVDIGKRRIDGTADGSTRIRPLDRPIYDPANSGKLARDPFRGGGKA